MPIPNSSAKKLQCQGLGQPWGNTRPFLWEAWGHCPRPQPPPPTASLAPATAFPNSVFGLHFDFQARSFFIRTQKFCPQKNVCLIWIILVRENFNFFLSNNKITGKLLFEPSAVSRSQISFLPFAYAKKGGNKIFGRAAAALTHVRLPPTPAALWSAQFHTLY